MSESRVDRSRRRLLIQNISSTQLLHKGLKRKISQNEYVKLYPRLKLSQKSRTHTLNLYRNEYSEEYMHFEVSKMREDNKLLEEENQELKTKMRKESKLNEIFEKRMDQGKIYEMSLDKLLEIKLLMEVEDLQEKLAFKEAEVAQLLKSTKRRKQVMEDYSIESQLDLYALLYSSEDDIIALKEQKEQKIRDFHGRHIVFNQRISKMRLANKQKTDELRKLTLSIEKQRVNLPKKSDLATENNDSGIYGLQNRNKNIEELESDIIKLKDEYSAFQIQIQESIDKKVRQKILLHKEIEQLGTAIIKNTKRGQDAASKTRW